METLAQSKFFIALGGFLGFCLTFASGMLAGNDASSVLRDASIGCVICAFLMKLLMNVIHNSVEAAMQKKAMEKRKELEALDDTELTDDYTDNTFAEDDEEASEVNSAASNSSF